MSDSGVGISLSAERAVGAILAAAGGLLLRDLWKWVKGWFQRRREAKRRQAELLEVLAEAAQFHLDMVRSQERMTATGRIRPVSAEELAQKQGNFQARRQELTRRLWEVTGHDERRGAEQKQDMFADEEDAER